MKSILVTSNKPDSYSIIRNCFNSGYKIEKAESKKAAIEMIRKRRADFVFIDLEMLREDAEAETYQEAMKPFKDLYPTIQLVVISPQDLIREAVSAIKEGANNYITSPINMEEVKFVTESIRKSIMVNSELDYLRSRFWKTDSLEIIRTNNVGMKTVYEKIRSVAPTRSTVLLTGETGTGKSLLAKLVHQHSSRNNAQFISVHCGAIPDTLIESELFGHEKGAFTGAVKRKLGKFEIAGGGTIFLDEIGTITPSAQIKLLQVLQDGTFERVGGEENLHANVRIIAATNVNLEQMCREGRFRSDLYYRLNVFPIEIPPLRERIEDIPHLVETFLDKMNKFNTKGITGVDPRVIKAFKDYSWPGNIRELENIMERAYILETGSILSPASFPGELFDKDSPGDGLLIDASLTLSEIRRKGIEELERRYLREILATARGRIKETAQRAGITTRQLHKLMTKYGLHKEEFKSSTVPFR